jgi:hypothetical protein
LAGITRIFPEKYLFEYLLIFVPVNFLCTLLLRVRLIRKYSATNGRELSPIVDKI